MRGTNLTALAGVDLTIHKAEFVSVLGSSGCGKSTLLKIMAGLLPPSAGRVVLDGRPVLCPGRDIGIMFQQATLLPWKTTIEKIVLPIDIRDGRGASHTLARVHRGPDRLCPASERLAIRRER